PAHALLHASDPPAGSTLGSAPSVVTLTYGETPDVRLTSVKVLDSSGNDHVAGLIEALTDPPNSIRVPIGPLADGAYTVSWRTVSAVDGHVSAGSFVFGIGVAPPSSPADQEGVGTSQSGSPPGILARWILYLGLVALIGAAFVAVAVTRRSVPDLLVMAAVGWVLAAIGTVGVVAAQWAETGAPIEELPGTSVGVSALARLIALAVLVEVGTLEALVGTSFGVVVLLKSAGLLALAALGAFNRFVTLRNAANLVGRMRRVGGAEITLAVVVLGLSALLVNQTPPTSAV